LAKIESKSSWLYLGFNEGNVFRERVVMIFFF